MFVLRYYRINQKNVSNLKRKVRIPFRKGIQENGIQDTNTKIKKMEYFHIFFVLFWRHGRAVRRGTANPFSPVQVWVSPDQQKNRNIILCFAEITWQIFSSRSKRGRGLLILVWFYKHPALLFSKMKML